MKAPVLQRAGNHLIHSLDLCQRLGGIDAVQSLANCGNRHKRRGSDAQYERLRIIPLCLRIGDEHCLARRVSQVRFADVGDDSNNLSRRRLAHGWTHWLSNPDTLSDGILVRPEFSGHGLIDYHHGRAASVVGWSEFAPAHERDPQCAEIVGTDDSKVRRQAVLPIVPRSFRSQC